MIQVLVAAFSGLIIGIFIGYQLRSILIKNTLSSLKNNSKNAKLDAEREAANIIRAAEIQAKTAAIKAREAFEATTREQKKQFTKEQEAINKREEILLSREQNLNSKADLINKKEAILDKRQEETDKFNASVKVREEKADALAKEATDKLQKLARFPRDEAKKELFEEAKKELEEDIATLIKREKENLKETSEEMAREIIIPAMQRYSSSHITDLMLRTVTFDDPTVKGKIIGREGRNIRALETATGIDLIIDDTPEAVILSGFDPVRREVARIALEKLIIDGRIHPARIEEMVGKAQKEVDNQIREAGENAVFQCDIHNLHPELIRLLGRLRYRTSYGQNVLNHALEVSHLAGMMAAEIGADVRLAKRGGLLHDIGKAIDHEVEGPHVQIGADLAKKYRENANVINCIAAHHGDVEAKSVEAVLVQAADAISAARPGARKESLENYIKRLESLEGIANSFAGVDKSYAIQAGREVRIIVKPDDVDDAGISLLARDIVKKIEKELDYPGQIKVNVIRETRSIDYAK